MAEEIKLTKRLQRVFDYMVEFNSITSLQAFTDLGETRLSGAIYELKKKGVNIGAEDIKVKNRYGESRIVTKYFIA
jgi:phosphoribosylformylglycinamidine (FGAM) synthase-like enzyme